MQGQGPWQPRKPAPGFDMPEYTGAPLNDTEMAQVRETSRNWAEQNAVIAEIMEARGGKMPSDWKQRVDDAGLRPRPPH